MARFDIAFYMKLKRMDYNDIKKLDFATLEQYTRKAVEMADNRQDAMLKYMRKKGINVTPAMREPDPELHKQSKSKFGKEEKFEGFQTYDFNLDKNKEDNINYLRYKLNMAKRFLSTETSNEKGFKKMLDRFANRIEEKFNIKVDTEFFGEKDRYDLLWRLFREVQDAYPESATNISSNEIQKMIVETMEDRTDLTDFEDLIDIALSKAGKLDKRKQREKLKEKEKDNYFDNQLKTGTERKNGYRTSKI